MRCSRPTRSPNNRSPKPVSFPTWTGFEALRMAIIEDYAAIAGELRRIRAEHQLKRAKIVVPIGVLRVPTRYSCGVSPPQTG